MTWQDIVLSTGQLFFVVASARALFNRATRIPRWSTSAPTAVALAVFAVVDASLSLPLATAGAVAQAVLWIGLAWRRAL